MAVGDVLLQADGAYVDAGGHLVKLNGIPRQTANNGLVVRWAPGNTTIVAARVNAACFDMRSVALMAIAIARGGLTYAELSAVAPGVATFLQGQNVVEGAQD
jgi:hypothetical protein